MSIRVAIVDDQDLVRGGFAVMLGLQDDIEVVAEAGNGVAAVEIAHRHRPDVILMDIRMPKIDGIEVLRRIKNDPLLKKIPVIMITTTGNPEDVDLCHNLGCSMYVVKPVEYESFVEAIRKVGMFLSIVEMPQVRQAV